MVWLVLPDVWSVCVVVVVVMYVVIVSNVVFTYDAVIGKQHVDQHVTVLSDMFVWCCGCSACCWQ